MNAMEKEVMECLVFHVKEAGDLPVRLKLEEIGDWCGRTGSSMQRYLKALAAKGLIVSERCSDSHTSIFDLTPLARESYLASRRDYI